jgi:hypothetical protein
MCFPSGLQQAEIQTTIEMTEEGISDKNCCKINICRPPTMPTSEIKHVVLSQQLP